jgi:hypothetical protein
MTPFDQSFLVAVRRVHLADRAASGGRTVPDKFRSMARRLQAYTGEPLQRAIGRLRSAPWEPAIPTATDAQAQFELRFLREVGRCGVSDGYGRLPHEPPWAMNWVSPYPQALEISVRADALPDLVGAVLPYWSGPGDDPSGVAGLRFRVVPGGVELFQLELPGVIRLVRVTPRAWWRAVAIVLDDRAEADCTEFWHSHPLRLAPAEEAFARSFAPGYHGTRGQAYRDVVALGSGLLRRQFVLARPFIPCVDLWMNPGVIELEWFNGPTHAEVIEALTDPVFGVQAESDAVCHCDSGRCRYCILLRTAPGAAGGCIALRRNSKEWDSIRQGWAEESQQRRAAAFARFDRSGPPRLVDGRQSAAVRVHCSA